MYKARTLRAKLSTLPLKTVIGPWSRVVANEYLAGPPPGAALGSGPDPLWPAGSKRHGARFTPKGGFDTAYLASTVDTALLEVGAVFRGPTGSLLPMATNPALLVTVNGVVLNVLDTTAPLIQAALRTTTAELTGVWAYAPMGRPPSQVLGEAAYASKRVHGILYTSSKNSPETCLCVFPERLDGIHEQLEVHDGSGTIVGKLP
ncbi:MAG: RES family NAD+ phosphorylase [Myxococcales bacterium]|nr:RES family NAD+ phosphorylase [Myxococcales bacterium]